MTARPRGGNPQCARGPQENTVLPRGKSRLADDGLPELGRTRSLGPLGPVRVHRPARGLITAQAAGEPVWSPRSAKLLREVQRTGIPTRMRYPLN